MARVFLNKTIYSYASGVGSTPTLAYVAYFSFNPLTGTLKLYRATNSNMVIGTLVVDGRAVTFGTAKRAWAGCGPGAPPSILLAVPNVTDYPSTASVPTSYYSMWHYKYLCPLKG